ncbi:MAG TPA: hypothetical protein GXZ21_00365 [Clostridiales bacterium]|nr:hypothetical protein [Clostridiales bacterium]
MAKRSVLDDNAEIYKIKKKKTEKEKLKDMTPKGRISYLWEYYRIHALGVILAVTTIIYIAYQIATPNMDTQFYAALINNTIANEVIEEVSKDFSEALQLNPETETIMFNTSLYMGGTVDYNPSTATSRQILTTHVAAQEVDVIIAPESEFKTYSYHGYFDKISSQLPTDLYTKLSDYFYFSDLEDDPEKNVYGIYLTDTALFANNAVNTDPYILGIVSNSEHKGNSIEFLRYLFDIHP